MTTRRATPFHGKAAPMGSGGMFVAAPPLARGKPVVSAAPHSKARVLKRAVAAEAQASNQAGGASIDSFVQEKLAFDELLRVQRSRAEDVGKLVAELGSALALESETQTRDREKGRKAAMFREEWRVGREDEVLGRLRAEEAREASMAEADRLTKMEVVRAHVRRSIHLFLTAERTPIQAAGESHKTKLSNDLFYAQQMDRLLREMDQNHPFTVVRHAIADARGKFQQLLNHVGRNADASTLLGLRPDPNLDASEDRASSAAGVEAAEDKDVLHLYENVIDARAVAQTTAQPVLLSTNKQSKRLATPRTHGPSKGFLANLEKQRWDADRQAAEALAQIHWKRVCAKRILLRYRRYRRRKAWQSRANALRRRVERRAATIIQTTFLSRVRQVRALEDAKTATKRTHQGRRVARCCFWKWIYPTRCGFATFQFTSLVTKELFTLIICIQSMWRRRKAMREVTFRRNFRTFRRKRERQRQWEQRRRQAQATAPLSLRLAEWLCHVAIEKRRVERELRREHTRFAAEWTRYESRLEKDVMKSRLPAEWIPQLDPVGGDTFYLNVQTTKTSTDHPNMLLCRQLLKKQKLRAEQLYDERLQRLEQYTARLETESEAMTAMLFEKMHMALN